MGKYFGTDGFRGEANFNLTVEHAYKVGRYLGYYFGKDKINGEKAKIESKDTRPKRKSDIHCCRAYSKRIRCLSDACYTNTKCIIYSKSRWI